MFVTKSAEVASINELNIIDLDKKT